MVEKKWKRYVGYSALGASFTDISDSVKEFTLTFLGLREGVGTFNLVLENAGGEKTITFPAINTETGLDYYWKFGIQGIDLAIMISEDLKPEFKPSDEFVIKGVSLDRELKNIYADAAPYNKVPVEDIIYDQVEVLNALNDVTFTKPGLSEEASIIVPETRPPRIYEVIRDVLEQGHLDAYASPIAKPSVIKLKQKTDSAYQLNVILESLIKATDNNILECSEPRSVGQIANYLTMPHSAEFSSAIPNDNDFWTESVKNENGEYIWTPLGTDYLNMMTVFAVEDEVNYGFKSIKMHNIVDDPPNQGIELDITKTQMSDGLDLVEVDLDWMAFDEMDHRVFGTLGDVVPRIELEDTASHVIYQDFTASPHPNWQSKSFQILDGGSIHSSWSGDTGTFNKVVKYVRLKDTTTHYPLYALYMWIDHLRFYKSGVSPVTYLEDTTYDRRELQIDFPVGYPCIRTDLWGAKQLLNLGTPTRYVHVKARIDPSEVYEDDDVTPGYLLPGWHVQLNVPRYNLKKVVNGGVWWCIKKVVWRWSNAGATVDLDLIPTTSESPENYSYDAGIKHLMHREPMIGVMERISKGIRHDFKSLDSRILVLETTPIPGGSLDQPLKTTDSPIFAGLTITGLDANRLVATNGSDALVSTDIADWLTGTSNEIGITDDGDGTATIYIPDSVTLVNLTVTDITIGSNTLSTSEFAYLDGQDQNVKQASSPRFARVYIDGSSEYIDSSGGDLTFTDTNTGTKTLAELAAGGGAPIDATYVTITTNGTLTAEVLISALGTYDVGGTNWSIVGATGISRFTRVEIDAATEYIDSSSGDLTFTDTNTGTKTLAQLAAGGADQEVNVFEAGTQVGSVARQLDFTNANDFNITEDTGNDQFDIAINRNSANGIAGLDASAEIADAQIPDVETLSYTSAFATAQIPSLDASKITSGTFNIDRIPTMDDAHIPDLETLSYGGAFATGQIPSLDASKITSGTFGNDRLDLSALAQNIVFTGAQTVDGVDVSSHHTRHEDGGADEVSLAASQITSGILAVGIGGLGKVLSPTWTDDYMLVYKTTGDQWQMEIKGTPSAHADSHEDGGGDEISVEGLSGDLADPQDPKDHVLGTTGPHTGTLPLTDLAVGSQGSIIRRGATDWEEYSLGIQNYVLKAGATDVAWGQVAHSELTGVTSDLHHAQLHASSHGDGQTDEVSLDASQITAGTFDLARIPTMDDAHIPDVETLSYTGAFATGQIPSLAASKITSGVLSATVGGLGKVLSPTWTNDYFMVYKSGSDQWEMELKGSPASHASTHEDGGADEVSLDASQIATGTFGSARLDLSALAQNIVFTGSQTVDGVDVSAHAGGTAKAQHTGGLGDHTHASSGAEGGTLNLNNIVGTKVTDLATLWDKTTKIAYGDTSFADQNLLTTSDVQFDDITMSGALKNNLDTDVLPIYGGTDLYGAVLQLAGKNHATVPGSLLVYTPDAAKTSYIKRLEIDGAADTVEMILSSSTHLKLEGPRTRITGFDGVNNHWLKYSADDTDLILGINRVGANNYDVRFRGDLEFDNDASELRPPNSDDDYFKFMARDNEVGLVEVARLLGAADPRLRIETELGFKDQNTYITRDGGNNLSFTDNVTGTKTLADLVGGMSLAAEVIDLVNTDLGDEDIDGTDYNTTSTDWVLKHTRTLTFPSTLASGIVKKAIIYITFEARGSGASNCNLRTYVNDADVNEWSEANKTSYDRQFSVHTEITNPSPSSTYEIDVWMKSSGGEIVYLRDVECYIYAGTYSTSSSEVLRFTEEMFNFVILHHEFECAAYDWGELAYAELTYLLGGNIDATLYTKSGQSISEGPTNIGFVPATPVETYISMYMKTDLGAGKMAKDISVITTNPAVLRQLIHSKLVSGT